MQRGDAEAFTELVDRYRKAVYGLAHSHLRSFEDAQDVAQEAFLQAFLHLEGLHDPAKFGPWLRRITVNECRMWRRRFRREMTGGDETIEVRLGTTDTGRIESRLLLEETLACLSEASRLTLTLFYVNDYSYEEIARFLEVPVTTVKSRLRDARARLRKESIDMVEETFQGEPLPADFTERVMRLTSRVMGTHDKGALNRFLSQDRPLHLCLLSELEKAESLEGESPDRWLVYWGAERDGRMAGALMRIANNWVPARSDPDAARTFAECLDGHDGEQLLYGPRETTVAIARQLKQKRPIEEEHEVLAVMGRLAVDTAAMTRPAHRAGMDFAERVADLYDNEEVPRHPSSVRAHINSRRFGMRLWCCADKHGRAVSACLTRYEAQDLALIGLRYTRPEVRGEGWTTACVAGLCEELLSEGKRPCVSYLENTPDETFYRKLGFEPYAPWSFYRLEPQPDSV